MQLLGAVIVVYECADVLQVVSCQCSVYHHPHVTHQPLSCSLLPSAPTPPTHPPATLPPSLPSAEGAAPSEVNSGANAFVYWTCPYPGGPWTQLPPVTPAQIKAARQVREEGGGGPPGCARAGHGRQQMEGGGAADGCMVCVCSCSAADVLQWHACLTGHTAPLFGLAPVAVRSRLTLLTLLLLLPLPPPPSLQIKKLLTGRLSSQVSSYPVFPGTEANYLRAQVTGGWVGGGGGGWFQMNGGNMGCIEWMTLALMGEVSCLYWVCVPVKPHSPPERCLSPQNTKNNSCVSTPPPPLPPPTPAPQIARISATTTAVPVGMYAANEEGGIDKAEEFTPLPAREMGASANWCHRWGRQAREEGKVVGQATGHRHSLPTPCTRLQSVHSPGPCSLSWHTCWPSTLSCICLTSSPFNPALLLPPGRPT
jgi:hypothetical protein